jgi:hypothetical protein
MCILISAAITTYCLFNKYIDTCSWKKRCCKVLAKVQLSGKRLYASPWGGRQTLGPGSSVTPRFIVEFMSRRRSSTSELMRSHHWRSATSWWCHATRALHWAHKVVEGNHSSQSNFRRYMENRRSNGRW